MRDYVVKARFDDESRKKLEYCAGYFGVTKSRLIEMQIEDLYDKLSKVPGDDGWFCIDPRKMGYS